MPAESVPDALRCKVCGAVAPPAATARMAGTSRDVADETYVVARCSRCGSLNALDPVDYDRIYRRYPIQKQRYDVFAKLLFAKRFRILRDAGLLPGAKILDYGCGSGHFVRYLVERGYDCAGYDPYSASYGDAAVLQVAYDWVLSQDVIEHVDEPVGFLAMLLTHVKPGGRLVVGTPYADHVDLHDPIDQVGVLHQPFHRFLVSMRQAKTLFSPPGAKLDGLVDSSYVDTAWPFANSMFLFHLFASGDRTMDFAFGPLPASHFLRHPTLLFWAFLGRLFARQQNLVAVLTRDEAVGRAGLEPATKGL